MNEVITQLQCLTPQEVEAVSTLAREVWQATYPLLISQAQIDAMLGDRYASTVIREQLNNPAHGWWVARLDGRLVGFAHSMLTPPDCKLDKLYIHPECQRRGIGQQLFQVIRQWALQRESQRIVLQVNRGNAQAIAAYQHYGFHIGESRVFDIGNGFVMDDHIMALTL